MELGAHRPWVPQSTLETDFPLPLYSDQYVTLQGPRQAPVLRQAVRWKTTPMGWDAAGQSWSTGLSGWDTAGGPWYTLTPGISRCRWQRAHTPRWGSCCLAPALLPPPVYAQHLREVAWWDPISPAAYPGPPTRWGAFLWQERPILGKEYGKSLRGCGGASASAPSSPLSLPLRSCHPQLEPQGAGGQPGVRPPAVLLLPPLHRPRRPHLEPPPAPALHPPVKGTAPAAVPVLRGDGAGGG
uniref:Chromosome 19 open reading frame 71 n=1 Tax=Anser cygnoides TaxID=8845 RepID=A0A8B9ILE9_ANSCY